MAITCRETETVHTLMTHKQILLNLKKQTLNARIRVSVSLHKYADRRPLKEVKQKRARSGKYSTLKCTLVFCYVAGECMHSAHVTNIFFWRNTTVSAEFLTLQCCYCVSPHGGAVFLNGCHLLDEDIFV